MAALADRAMSSAWTREQFREALGARRLRLRWRAAPSGGLQGFVLGRRVARDLVEIDLVAVDPAHRRRGIARGLLESLMAEERAKGIETFRLELAERNDAARALYTGVGFVVVGRRPRYYPDGDDALLLTWTAADRGIAVGREQRRGD